MICPICDREMIEETCDKHHLIPSALSGKEKILIHIVCHDKLHHTFTERDMLNYYHTLDRIREHKQIQKFIKWISKKDIYFNSKNKDTKQRKKKRKR